MAELQALHDAVVAGDAGHSRSLAAAALAAGAIPLELVNHQLIPAMDEVGRRFERGEYFVPELLLAARAMKAAMEPIRPRLAGSAAPPAARVVIGTVKGDMHDIGKNLVGALLEGGGFEVVDLGVNVAPETFLARAREVEARLVGLSALLTTTMGWMGRTIEAFQAAGLRDRVKIMVGGAPVSRQFATEIGADGYGESAPAAVALARRLIGQPPHS